MGKPGRHSPITVDAAGSLCGLFYQRVQRSPAAPAYRYYDTAHDNWKQLNWAEAGALVARWQLAMRGENLQPGERVAIMLQNCPEWVMFDQSALANALVVVPLYTQDRAANVAYILKDAGVKLLLLGGQAHWDSLQPVWDQLDFINRIVSLEHIDTAGHADSRLKTVGEWLPDRAELTRTDIHRDTLATIVYTSGTTGRPKGVMLSHGNILWNAARSLQTVECDADELFLSFLPLSHMLERTAGYYLPMILGACVAYNRSIAQLADDLLAVRPTIIISVPRIFERVHNKIQLGLEEKSPLARTLFRVAVDTGWQRFEHAQGRAPWRAKLLLWPILKKLVAEKVTAKLGGRLRVAVVGGAPLPGGVARLFLGLGLPLIQGYGLTETSPVISVNRVEDNDPASAGCLLEDVQARIGEQEELLVRSPGVMLGYWNNPQASRDMIDDEGWLHTGDKARLQGTHLYITGRLKEILVLANGEKIPPADMEMAICMDALFEQAMVIGDGRPYLSALVVLNREQWRLLAKRLRLDADDPAACNLGQIKEIVLERLTRQISAFPGYAQIRAIHCQLDPWTIEDGLMTPTLKLKRDQVFQRFQADIEAFYAGH